MARKICVKFGDLKSPVRVKLFTLPEPSAKQCDFLLLRSMLYKEMTFDMSITDLGGSLATRVEDVMLSQYDKEFDLLVDVTSSTVFLNGEKDITVKIRHTEYVVVPEDSQVLDIPPISPCQLSENSDYSQATTTETVSINSSSKLSLLILHLLSLF